MGSNNNLDELEALFEDDDFQHDLFENENTDNADKTNQEQTNEENNENLTNMEAEYMQLQKQMELLKEKMKTKGNSATSDIKNQIEISDQTKSNETKRSFFDAFGSSFSDAEPVENVAMSSVKVDDQPTQKKRRVTHNTTPMPSSGREVPVNARFSNQPKPKLHSKLKGTENLEIEKFSRIRLKQRYVPASELYERMSGKTYIKLSLIRPTFNLSENTDWVTIAVVAKQLDPQTARNGKKFSIWHLSDLDDCTKHSAFFLFGQVHEELWKNVTVGTVIGLLNPSIMPPKRDDSTSGKSFDNSPALTVDMAERVMKIGVSADLGWCMATKYRNKQPAGKCLAFINKQFGDVCVFHMQSRYKKLSSKRGELQGSVAPPVAAKYKNTLWNKVRGEQFFYGGQTFSAAPPSLNPNVQRKESKIKLTKVFSSVNNKSIPEVVENKKHEVERSKIMQAISGIDGEQSVTGCSKTFADMLVSGDMVAGSRQFLNHLQKKQNVKIEHEKPTKNLSPSVLLKEQRNLIDERKKNGKTRPAMKSTNVQFATSDEIKKSTEKLLEMKRQRFEERKKSNSGVHKLMNDQPHDGTVTPRLGADVNGSREVDLFGDWLSSKSQSTIKSNSLPSLAELRKRKAIAKLRNEDGKVEIKKSNPNRVGIGQIENIKNNPKVQEKLKEKVVGNEVSINEEFKENIEKEEETCLNGFRNTKLSKEEFEKILKATSSHSIEAELEEMEKQEQYFNPLIKKEMMEEKMSNTSEISSKVVSCAQCNYTYWVAHDRCKKLEHSLQWRNVKKRFFECTNCKQRTTSWEPYPTKSCRICGSEKKWKRTTMFQNKDVKLDSELLHIRGIEHSKFINSIE